MAEEGEETGTEGKSAPAPGGVARTPDERFVGLPGYPFSPHYAMVEAEGMPPLRMHYIDEGPADGPVVLLLHGQPTWSYLYRKVIPVLTSAGLRAVAPDLIGYGRSDKPMERNDYTLARHIQWMSQLLHRADLDQVTLVSQDWGGPIGLGVLASDPNRFAAVVATNTVLHTSDPALKGALRWANHALGDGRVVLEEALVDYVLFSLRVPEYSAGSMVDATVGPLEPAVRAAYDAPFPDAAHQGGVRQMSALIPLTRNDPGAAICRETMTALRGFTRPFLTAFSDGDPATQGWETVLRQAVPGAQGQDHEVIEGAGHFVQEQRGEELGAIIVRFVGSRVRPGR